MPTLVGGAADDLLTPDARSVAAAIPHATCEVVPDAGHAVLLEAPAAVLAAFARLVG
jgi:pimeloyl-ACP methyl ester carboxylesterase